MLRAKLPADEKAQLKEKLELLAVIEQRTETIKKRIAVRVYRDADIKRLLTVTGFDLFTAVAIKSAVGTMSRSPSPKKLVSYFGLGTAVYQSADTVYTSRITCI
jgi:transposase